MIADTDDSAYVFTDDQVTSFLTLESDNVYRAAGVALEVHARHIAQVAGAVRGLLDVQLGGIESAEFLRDEARRLRSRAGGTMRSVWASNWTYAEDFPS